MIRTWSILDKYGRKKKESWSDCLVIVTEDSECRRNKRGKKEKEFVTGHAFHVLSVINYLGLPELSYDTCLFRLTQTAPAPDGPAQYGVITATN